MVLKFIFRLIFKLIKDIVRWSTDLAAKASPSQGVPFRVWSVKDDEYKVMLGLLDTGATRNWVHRDQVERLGATPISPTEVVSFRDFQGGRWTAESQVKLQWHRIGSTKSREGYFFVAENGPFDILLGSDFLYPEGVLEYVEPALTAKEDEKQKKR